METEMVNNGLTSNYINRIQKRKCDSIQGRRDYGLIIMDCGKLENAHKQYARTMLNGEKSELNWESPRWRSSY